MKIPVTIFVNLLIFLISFSCKKSNDTNNGGGSGGSGSGGVNDSIYMIKAVTIDTTLPPGADTLYTTSVSYDNQKRVDSIIAIAFPFRNSVQTSKNYEKRFYNGNDTLPYKTFIIQVSHNGSIQYNTHFLFYDSDKIIFKDSIIQTYSQNPSVDISRELYYRNGSRITSVTQHGFSLPPFQTFDSTVSIVSKNGGNTISSIDSAFYLPFVSKLVYVTKYSANYDNKPNPFDRIKLPYPVYFSNYFGHFSQKATNNFVSSTYEQKVSSGITNNSAFVSYIYNANGYPVVSRFTLTPSFTRSKSFIYYTAL